MIKDIKPADIEKQSFRIISEELAGAGKILDPRYEMIIKRCIHTSADFDYAGSMYFTDGVTERIAEAMGDGLTIVTDTQMARSGINKRIIEKHGGSVHCFIADQDVAAEAKARAVTRSYVSMERATEIEGRVLFAIGNAPTALVSICSLYKEGRIDPVGVIGAPVGFVNVVESKEMLIASGIPCIVARGRKGGSNIAAAIVNAIQYEFEPREGI